MAGRRMASESAPAVSLDSWTMAQWPGDLVRPLEVCSKADLDKFPRGLGGTMTKADHVENRIFVSSPGGVWRANAHFPDSACMRQMPGIFEL